MISVPDLRFPGFEGEWKTYKLGEIGFFKNGINKDKEAFGFGVPFINLMDVFGKSTVSELNLSLVNANLKECELYNLIKGDTLFIRSSVKRTGVGETSLVLKDMSNIVYSGFLIRYRTDTKKFFYLFKKYCFWTTLFRNQLISYSTTSANTNINQESLSILRLNIPSIIEQQKISSFLNAIDSRISTQSEIIEDYEEIKKGMMQQLFSQQLRFKDDNGANFPDWEEKRLDGYCSFFSGGTPISTTKRYYKGNIPFIGSGNISQDSVASYISEEALKNSSAKLVEKGDVLYALYGATSGEVSISKISGAINQAVLCIRTKEIDSYLLFQVLKMNKEKITSKYLQGGQGNLSAKIIRNLKFLIPSSKKEQTKIANFLSSIDERLEKEKQLLETYKQQKKYLLQNMFV